MPPKGKGNSKSAAAAAAVVGGGGRGSGRGGKGKGEVKTSIVPGEGTKGYHGRYDRPKNGPFF